MPDATMAVPLSRAFPMSVIPIDKIVPVDGISKILDNVLITSMKSTTTNPEKQEEFEIGLSLDKEAEFSLPGLDGVSLVFGGKTDSLITVGVAHGDPPWKISLSGGFRVRFSRSILRPVVKKDKKWVEDTTKKYVELKVTSPTVTIDHKWNVDFETISEFTLPPAMIGESGFVLEGKVALDLSESKSLPETNEITIPGTNKKGLGDSWRGVVFKTTTLHLPSDIDIPLVPGSIKLTNFHIGSGGVSGTVTGNWSPTVDKEKGSISGNSVGTLGGVQIGLKTLSLTFVQNSLTVANVTGALVLPFLGMPLDVKLGFDLKGNISVLIDQSQGSLASFDYEVGSEKIFTVSLDRIGLARQDGKFVVKIGGSFLLLVGGLNWPKIAVKELAIDSDGNVSVSGGWLELPQQLTLDFYGFQFELSKIGFGKEDDGTKWIGVSGGVKLIDGLPMGVSVEGLRIKWTPGGKVSLSFSGIGVDFTVAEVVQFAGKVSFVEEETRQYFAGDIKLKLIALGLNIGAQLLVGKTTTTPIYTFFSIALDLQLPVGITLGSTGLALYGMRGMFAYNMEPSKGLNDDNDAWFEKADGNPGWYKREPIGVTDPVKKWYNRQDAIAIGAGVTLGTAPDNGYSFSAGLMLVICLPGPIIIFEGRAQVLTERAQLSGSGDAPLKALMVIDGRSGTFLFNAEATYRQPSDSGSVIDVHGGAEAYFSRSDWHFYIGQKTPLSKRIRAQILKIIEANLYFGIDSKKVETGVHVGFNMSASAGPVSAHIEAWLAGEAMISWKPVQLAGMLGLHGALRLEVFGLKMSLRVDAKLEATAPTPYMVRASLEVELDLPWFLPDVSVDIVLEWSSAGKPPVPLPLKEIAIGHHKVTDTWAVKKLPAYDNGAGFWSKKAPALPPPQPTEPPQQPGKPKSPTPIVPVAPLDSRIVLSFSRKMDDRIKLDGFLASPPTETVGKTDHRYELVGLKLEKVEGKKWVEANRKTVVERQALNPTVNTGSIVGHWQAAGSKGQAATKLYLGSKSGFEYMSAADRTWADGFLDANPGYPCRPPRKLTKFCVNFDGMLLGTVVPWAFLHSGLVFYHEGPAKVVKRTGAATLPQQALEVDLGKAPLMVFFPQPVALVSLDATGGGQVELVGYHKGTMVATAKPSLRPELRLPNKSTLQGFDRIEIKGSELTLVQLCYVTAQELAGQVHWEGYNYSVQSSTEQWKKEDRVLEPNTVYRLEVTTRVRRAKKGTGNWEDAGPGGVFKEYGYFRTEGPPGYVTLPKRKQKAQQLQGKKTTKPAQQTQTQTAKEIESPHPLSSLKLYMAPRGRTIPGDDQLPAVGKRKEQGQPPGPAYRGYDVGLEFNENYVELMYAMAGKDLQLYVLDNNQHPVRDVKGRLVTLRPTWDKTRKLTLSWDDSLWVAAINSSDCAVLDTSQIRQVGTMGIGGRHFVLRPRTLHEVRALALLLHDDFRRGIKTWGAAVDEGTHGGKSNWKQGSMTANGITNYFVTQTGNHYGETEGDPADKPGTYLLRGSVSWSDYRVSVTMRSSDDDAIGVMFRFKDSKNYYRFSMDQERAYRRLIKKVNGKVTVLAQDGYAYRTETDYVVTAEAIGDKIRVYIDGELIFDVTDGAIKNGRIGLYCWGNVGTRFSDVKVDDCRATTPPLYSFELVTSRYVDFVHHAHSFRDVAWDLSSAKPATLEARAMKAQAKGLSDTLEEAKDFAALLGLKVRATPQGVDISVLRDANRVGYALLVESPEPLRWKRLGQPSLLHAKRTTPTSTPPRQLKAINVNYPTPPVTLETEPNQENVTLLLLDDLNLSGYAVQHLRMPGSMEPVIKQKVLLVEDFQRAVKAKASSTTPAAPKEVSSGTSTPPSGGSTTPTIPGGKGVSENKPGASSTTPAASAEKGSSKSQPGEAGTPVEQKSSKEAVAADSEEMMDISSENSMNWAIVDEGKKEGPSKWAKSAGVLSQTSNIHGEGSDSVDKPGTYIVGGSAVWDDYRTTVQLRSDDDDVIGVMFRYKDANNYYRFSMDRERSYRRLIKKVRGKVTVLASKKAAYETGRKYTVTIDAFGDQLQVVLDGRKILEATDSDLSAGKVGLYCWGNQGARFFNVRVLALPPKADCMFEDEFFASNLAQWSIVDEVGTKGQSVWQPQKGLVYQTGNTWGGGGSAADLPGTLLLAGKTTWGNYVLSARMKVSAQGASGVVFRYLNAQNYYRFSVDYQTGYRRLIRKAGGTVTVLWEDLSIAAGGKVRDELVAIHLLGNRIRGSLDGVPVFDINDTSTGAPATGKIGLYCWKNPKGGFADVHVWKSAPVERTLLHDTCSNGINRGRWQVVDEGRNATPAAWEANKGVLRHTSNTHGGSLDPSQPDKPGTYVVGGEDAWDDYSLSARVWSTTGYAIGLMGRYQDSDNYYRFSMDRQLRYRRLVRKKQGVVKTLWEDKGQYKVGQQYTMALVFTGTVVKVVLDGVEICSCTDGSVTHGKVGLYCWGNSGAYFDDVQVTGKKTLRKFLVREDFVQLGPKWSAVQLVPSTTASGWQTSGGVLEHINTNPGTALVAGNKTWTNYQFSCRLRGSGRGSVGVTFGYLKKKLAYFLMMDRKGMRLIHKQGGATNVVWQVAERLKPGEWHNLVVDLTGNMYRITLNDKVLTENKKIGGEGGVGLVAWGDDKAQFDNVLVTCPETKTVSLLVDDFSSGKGKWTVVDEGTPSPAAKWSGEMGAITQLSEAQGGSLSPTKVAKPGTHAVAGKLSWSDYRFTARLRSDSENGIGVLFRYKDAKNYYRFSMDRRLGYRRLVKMVNGEATELKGTTAASYKKGRTYLVTVDAMGDRLCVYLDGTLFCDCIDAALPQGKVGLYCWGNDKARFEEISVTAPQFVDYYRFGMEQPLAAGTVVRLLSGHSASLKTSTKDYEERFVAERDHRGWPLLNAAGDQIRILDPTGATGHQRIFLPVAEYSKVKTAMIRQRDGTAALFTLPVNGKAVGTVPDGHYQMSLTFERDIEKNYPSEPVLRRAGSSVEEQATLAFCVSKNTQQNVQQAGSSTEEPGFISSSDLKWTKK